MALKAADIRRVHALIFNVIETEPKNKPYTDQEIADQVGRTLGLTVRANRIHYYRYDLGIPNSWHRRERTTKAESK